MRKNVVLIFLFVFIACLYSCREEETYIDSEEIENVALPTINTSVKGFFLLNEGNMGMNRASIDYFDYETGDYHRNIYPSRNPSQVKELGDVGNDIQIYRNKLFAIINVSNYVEVMDLNGKHLKSIDIPNCRYIVFNNDRAYISSYATPVSIDPNAGKGLVFEIDLNTLTVVRKVEVGYQPEQMVIKNNKLYVANSGGYRVPHYDYTISVVDLDSFQELKKIEVAINLHRMEIDNYGKIYVTSRGDYYNVAPSLYVIDSETEQVIQKIEQPVSQMCLVGDLMYFYGVQFSYNTGKNKVSYGILDTKTRKVISDHIITDGTEKQIMMPYGLYVNPETKEIFITDAQDYVVSGMVYCFSAEGKFQWKVLAGNIPAHMAFVE